MPDKHHKELQETVAQVRALIEDLQLRGVTELPLGPDPAGQPLCRFDEQAGGSDCRGETLEEIRTDL
ncbi:MAG: hypothetical protein R2864_15600, partial [Syntrophotaleaceae bacterium]